MLAERRHQVVGRELLEEGDVGHQPRARENPLEEIMAQDGVLGHAAGERCLEGVHVIDALTGVGSLAEEILVDVRHRRGIGVDPARAG